MPKIENPHYIRISLDGQRATISQSEYKPSSEEWNRRRTEAFAELRNIGFIPDELLDLVEQFKDQTVVRPFVYRPGEKVELRFGVEVLGSEEDGGEARSLAKMLAAHERMQEEDKKDGVTASEALAFFLRIFVHELRDAEKNRKAAPVRSLNLVSQSLIAEIAMDLLESCELWGYPPGPLLTHLMRELLNLGRDRHGMSRNVDAQEQAADILAHDPTVRTRELARAVHVNASTISRWRKDPEFKRMVDEKTLSARTGR